MDKQSKQNKRLIEAGQAAVNMSHGIKNIAQSIRSGGDVIDKALEIGDIERAKRAWAIIKHNLGRIQKLSLDMLKFSKDEDLNVKPCDFIKLIESAIQTVRPQADQKQISIIPELDEHLEPIPMDPEKMQDVILNLLFNAIEAVEPQTGHIIVHAELDSAKQSIILCISDNGPGIEDTSIIFEPFHSTKDNVGAGLGLAIARKIVEKHGGTLQAASLSEEGAIFTACIPLNRNQ